MLYPAFPQYPALPPFVLVPELPALAVGDDFVIAVRMQGPDCARGERVVIEHAQGAEMGISGIVLLKMYYFIHKKPPLIMRLSSRNDKCFEEINFCSF